MNDSRKIWENIFQISQAVFKVTHLFPKDEILRRHLREKITEILYQSSPIFGAKNYENMIKETHYFRSLLFTSRHCNFVNEKNLTILIKACGELIEVLDQKDKENCRIEIKEEQGRGNRNFTVAELLKNTVPQKRNIQDLSFKVHNTNNSPIGFSVLNIRQQKIVDYFKKTTEDKIRLKNLATEFKDTPQRTLRQDLKDLCDNGFLARNGFGPGSFYFFIKNDNK